VPGCPACEKPNAKLLIRLACSRVLVSGFRWCSALNVPLLFPTPNLRLNDSRHWASGSRDPAPILYRAESSSSVLRAASGFYAVFGTFRIPDRTQLSATNCSDFEPSLLTAEAICVEALDLSIEKPIRKTQMTGDFCTSGSEREFFPDPHEL
jgi:hypothetical protein